MMKFPNDASRFEFIGEHFLYQWAHFGQSMLCRHFPIKLGYPAEYCCKLACSKSESCRMPLGPPKNYWGMAEILDHLRRSFPTLSFHRTGSVVGWSWKARMPGKQDINAAFMLYLSFSLQRRWNHKKKVCIDNIYIYTHTRIYMIV